jgi:hypothetical protein
MNSVPKENVSGCASGDVTTGGCVGRPPQVPLRYSGVFHYCNWVLNTIIGVLAFAAAVAIFLMAMHGKFEMSFAYGCLYALGCLCLSGSLFLLYFQRKLANGLLVLFCGFICIAEIHSLYTADSDWFNVLFITISLLVALFLGKLSKRVP